MLQETLKLKAQIFSESIGEQKSMSVLVTNHDNSKKLAIQLQNGALLIMEGKFNSNWLHAVPNKANAKRINLTLRLIHQLNKSDLNQSIEEEEAPIKSILKEIRKLQASVANLQLSLEEKRFEINKLHEKLHSNLSNSLQDSSPARKHENW